MLSEDLAKKSAALNIGLQNANTRLLDLLSHVGQIMSSSKSLDAVLLATVNLIKVTVGVERCSILILDATGQALTLRAASNIPQEEWGKVRVAIGSGISGRVARDGKHLLVENIDESEFRSMSTPQRYSTHSFICVPLMVKGHTIGVINVNNKSDATPFGRNHLDLMIALAGFIALAIENSRLYKQSENIRSHLENVVESLHAAVVTLNLKWHITACNARFLRLLGLTRETCPDDEDARGVFPADLLRAVEKLFQETTEYRVESRAEIEFESPVYAKVPLEINMSPLNDANGRIDGVLVTLDDISVRREVQELRRLDELKSNFMSLVSHELRTPLTSIKGSVHLLTTSMAEGMSDQQSKLIGIVHNNTERLTRLVSDLLDMVHIENNTFSIIRRPENLRPILEACVNSYRLQATGKSIAMQEDLNDVTATVDRERIHQAICNLMDNAIKFTPKGGRISVRLWASNGTASISVRDNGCGIKPECRGQLFTRFFQSENPLTRSAGGTGIGLYIAKSIIELHSGTIKLGNGSETGTEFIVELPRSAVPE